MEDLDQRVILVRTEGSSEGEARRLSLFDAVRHWTDAEGTASCDIEMHGKRLTSDDIEAIVHSEKYKDRLLAFYDRR